MVSLSTRNSHTVSKSNNSYLDELDDYYPKFLSGELSVKEQVDFIQTVIDLDLQKRYDLHYMCKYFILEGFCYDVNIGDT